MDIENLIKNIKKNYLNNPIIQNVKIEDKTYLHIKSFLDKNKFHLKLTIYSNNLKKSSKIKLNKKNSIKF